MIIVGIDPGTETGFATWDPIGWQLGIVTSVPIHRALESVADLNATHAPGSLLVMFEDCRLLRMRGGRGELNEQKYGGAVQQGVGSIKRDCSIWEDFLRDKGIPFRAKLPTRQSLKWNAAKFETITKWSQRTNNHARDAAVVVYGINRPIAEGLIRAWLEDRDRKPTPTAASLSKARARVGRRSRSSSIATGG